MLLKKGQGPMFSDALRRLIETPDYSVGAPRLPNAKKQRGVATASGGGVARRARGRKK